MKSRIFFFGIVFLTLAAALTFAAGSKERAAAEARVTVDFMHFFIREQGGNESFFWAVDEFRRRNPNVELREDIVQHDQYHGARFKTLAAANELPHLFMINTMELRPTVQQNLLKDWTPVLSQHPDWKNSFMDGVLTEVTLDGRIWGVPRQMIANNAIFYNADILAKAGYSTVPATWPEFMEMSGKLKQLGYVPAAMGNQAGFVAVSNFLEVLVHRHVGEEWFSSIRDNSGAKYTDRGFVDALRRFKEFNDAGFFNSDAVSINNNEVRQIYYLGEAAMLIDGSWGVGAIAREAPEEITAATRPATMPTVPGGRGPAGVLTGGSGWSYASNTRLSGATQDAVVEFAQLLTSIDVAKMTIETNAMSPIRDELVPFDPGLIHPLQRMFNDLMGAAPVLATMYAVQVNPAVADTLYRKVQELMIGAATPEEVAAEAQRTYERSW